jgi:hypothetical protein
MDSRRASNREGAAANAGGEAGGRTAVGEELDQLARAIQQLRIDFERFFNGALPIPPEEQRGRVQARLKRLRNANLSSAVDSFRLGDLEARFNTWNELFNRRVREREEGHRPPPRVVLAAERRFDPSAGVVFGDRIEPAAAEALYQGLASGPGSSPKFDLDSFQSYLAKQVAAIRQKTGCEQVHFRLAEEDGRLKLKARPMPGPRGS